MLLRTIREKHITETVNIWRHLVLFCHSLRASVHTAYEELGENQNPQTLSPPASTEKDSLNVIRYHSLIWWHSFTSSIGLIVQIYFLCREFSLKVSQIPAHPGHPCQHHVQPIFEHPDHHELKSWQSVLHRMLINHSKLPNQSINKFPLCNWSAG